MVPSRPVDLLSTQNERSTVNLKRNRGRRRTAGAKGYDRSVDEVERPREADEAPIEAGRKQLAAHRQTRVPAMAWSGLGRLELLENFGVEQPRAHRRMLVIEIRLARQLHEQKKC